ncbi:mannose-6-phosphate isomerase, class I [Microbacterium sp. Bi128]|uniref:mannose-6-phosphate isomerase, class I n=1 Tax=Microbacterium sp. Bi128 TaxID=2821115 RepID=UPI001D446DB5|nr:mannose-6-phosphate isomerase, class I [Microbacterium sp. Bi128]CAH0148097.1 Mannose-6-phosphate isomerase [Microbacterium sp. Bi128]
MLVEISNTPRDYAWGSATLLADLEGRTPSGAPEAEVWFGDHPGSPALVHDGSDRTLDAWLGDHSGEAGVPARLPYLLKLLAAGAPLSIQVHPSQEQAVEGFAREEAAGVPVGAGHRNYKDDNHKPEVIVALSETFTALAGLRDLAATRRLVDALGDADGVRALRERLDAADPSAALRAAIGWVLGEADAAAIEQIVTAAASGQSEEFAAELRLTRTLASAYPADPGIVVALLMNLVELRRGEAIFVPAGVLHAYVAGLGVEIMAASDNVLRGGLTPKHIDVAELLALVDFRPAAPPLLAPRAAADGTELFAPGIRDFSLAHVAGAHVPADVVLRGVSIALSVAGRAVVTGASGTAIELAPGQAAVVTPDESPVTVTGGEVFVAMPGE